MAPPLTTITVLADRPDLAARWAELHWREWGSDPRRTELSWWVADASRALGRTEVPAAFLALDQNGDVLGGVGVHRYDLDERRDHSPWVVGMIVREERRGEGIGQALLAYLEAWAVEQAGIEQVWVATETTGRAVAFYVRCGYAPIEEIAAQRGELVTVLTKKFSPTRPAPLPGS